MRHDASFLAARPLADCADPNHGHDAGWVPSYDGGKMDGACTTIMGYGPGCPTTPSYPCPPNSQNATDCTEYAYVSDPAIQPYWDIAEKYGFANYMFQTNQGPSFPAHQFLLSGTSQQDSITNPFYQYFAAENMDKKIGGVSPMEDAGCAALTGQLVPLISPPPTEGESTTVYPCFEHPTLTDLLDKAPTPIPWRWYSDQANSIWTAPNAINHICNNSMQNGNEAAGRVWGPTRTGKIRGAVFGTRRQDGLHTHPRALSPGSAKLQFPHNRKCGRGLFRGSRWEDGRTIQPRTWGWDPTMSPTLSIRWETARASAHSPIGQTP